MSIQPESRLRLFALGLVLAGAAALVPRPAAAQFNGDFTVRRTSYADENFLDWRSYQLPISWRYDWYTTRNGMLSSVGSISKTQFYASHEIKLMADLSPLLTFLYMQEMESFGRDNGLYQEAEMRVGADAHLSVVGWAQPEKRYDNIGVAASWGGREDMDFLRLTFLRQFAEYNARSTDAAANAGEYDRPPDLYRLEARRFWDGRLLTALELKFEERAEFEERDSGLTREYQGEEITAYADWWGAERDWLVGAWLWGDRERREQSPRDDAATESGVHQRQEWYAWEAYTWMRVDGGDEWTIGLSDAGFSNHIGSSDRTRRFDFDLATTQAFAQWERGPGEGWHWLFSAQAGYVESSRRDGADADTNRDEDSWQAKGGTALVLQSAGRHRLLFLATWDLDSFLTRLWDGGAVQVQITF